jgi:hypothetical protein
LLCTKKENKEHIDFRLPMAESLKVAIGVSSVKLKGNFDGFKQ